MPAPAIAEIRITRDLRGPQATLGIVEVRYPHEAEWKAFGFVCEDVDRGLSAMDSLEHIKSVKVHGKTAIPWSAPAGYRVVKTWSQRFQRDMWGLEGVPGWAGIRFHTGNTADDTEGCICVALARNTTTWSTSQSKVANEWLEGALDAAQAQGIKVRCHIRMAA